MLLLPICLVLLASAVVEIAANNDAVPYELLYYYNVYKMEYTTGPPLTLASDCRPSTGIGGSCFFDDFVKHIMDTDSFAGYKPTAADHTRSPTGDNLATVRRALRGSARYDMQRLFPGINLNAADGNRASTYVLMQRLQEQVLRTVNKALETGDALADDARTALASVGQALRERRPQADDAISRWLEETLTKAEADRVVMDSQGIDWDSTIDDINKDTSFSQSDRNTLKDKLAGMSASFGLTYSTNSGLHESDRNHLSIMRMYQDSITQIQSAVNRALEDDVRIPKVQDTSSSCPTGSGFKLDYTSDSSSGGSSSSGSGWLKRDNQHLHDDHLAMVTAEEPQEGQAFGKPGQLVGRQLVPISVSTLNTATSASSTTSSSSSSSSTTPVTTPQTPSPTSTGYDMAVTTLFSAPPECSAGITEMETMTGVLWRNIIEPVPDVTMTSCFPSQFVASALATTSLPPFSKLVCPSNWESYNVNSTYAICCPGDFGLYAPNFNNPERPGRKAICTSIVWPSVLMDVTSYGPTAALATVLPRTAGPDGDLVFAQAFEGNTVEPVITATSTAVTSTTATSTSTTTAPTDSTTSSQTTTTATTSAAQSELPVSSLPACGQLCWNNMLAQYESLGCSGPDAACLCRNSNFGYGLRDCSNGACGAEVASTVIAFGSSACSQATATATATRTTTDAPAATGVASLPACGQLCWNNMMAQYGELGCSSPEVACVCRNANFGYGVRDCSNAVCGPAVASTVIAFASSYCASAIAAAP